jgi:hypothetical protein
MSGCTIELAKGEWWRSLRKNVSNNNEQIGREREDPLAKDHCDNLSNDLGHH